MKRYLTLLSICYMSLFNILSCKSQDYIIPPQYIAVKPFHGGIAAVKTNDLWGLIDNTNTMVITPQFADITYSSETGYRVIFPDGNKKQLVLEDVDPGYTLSDISEKKYYFTKHGNLQLISKNNLVGVAKEDGTELISPQFDEIIYLGQDLFICKEYGEGDFLINDNGKILFHEIMGEIIPEISYDRIQYRGNDKSGMIDTTGRILMAKKYWRFIFAGNCIACTEGGKLALINNKGEKLSEAIYDEIIPLSENSFIALNTDNGNGTIYDAEGNIVVTNIFIGDGRIVDGLLPAKNQDEKYGYIDASGKNIIPYTHYYAATFFENGTAVFGEKIAEFEYATGLIDKTGTIILPAEYQQIYYKNGIYTVIKDDKFQLLDNSLQAVTPLFSEPIEYLGHNIYATYKMKTKIEYNNPSIWFGTKGGFNLYKEGIVIGIYTLKGKKLIDGSDYDPKEALPECSEGLIAIKNKGKWGFIPCDQ
ncbi:MAG: WG repeat-containing protein [Bacteroidetes bacterium]|nr:WG repeat-containing protein [Bacteroidota bacterium]